MSNTHTKYFEVFFEEKGIHLEDEFYEVEHGGQSHFIEGGFLKELIFGAPVHEQKSIANVLRRIDFANGNVKHFLRHLAEGYVKANY